MDVRRRLTTFFVIAAAVAASFFVRVDPAGATTTYFIIRNHNSGACLWASSGAGERPVYQYQCLVESARWEIDHLSPDTDDIRIRHKQTGLCLVARGTGKVRVVQSTCGQWADQEWDLRPW